MGGRSVAGEDRPTPDVERRVDRIISGSDLTIVASALVAQRDQVLTRWLEAARRQPFHRDDPDRAVADDIPRLFDAIVDLLQLGQSGSNGTEGPLDDPAVAAAARSHAKARFEQGLGPVATVTEFRLLRQEIGRALVAELETEPADDVVAGLVMVGDALDGAASIGLTALSDRIEEVRESFLATTLHDIRQPTTLIEGSLHLAEKWLTEPDPDTDRIGQAIRDAIGASEELRAMLETMSDASRVSMGALEPEVEPASLEGILDAALEALGRTARDRVTVDDAAPGHVLGNWDPVLIRRVIANLIGNAIKYSPPDSPINVRIERHEEEGAAELTVRDAGIGLTSEEIDLAFERFGRADRARRQGIPGLGLGLYACQGIIAAHGGRIVLESEGPDLGTTVRVRLPLLIDTDQEA